MINKLNAFYNYNRQVDEKLIREGFLGKDDDIDNDQSEYNQS